jgi:hypothetical protein
VASGTRRARILRILSVPEWPYALPPYGWTPDRPPYAWLWTVPYPTKGLLVEYTQALELIVLKELGKMPQ